VAVQPASPATLEPRHRAHRRRMTPRVAAVLATAAFLLAAAIFPSAAAGVPDYLANFRTAYPASLSDNQASCALCHTKTTSELNAYGHMVQTHGTSVAAIKAIGSLDADGNGISNVVEIATNAQPGWKPGAVNKVYSTSSGALVASTRTSPLPAAVELDPAPDAVPPVVTTAPKAAVHSGVRLTGSAIPLLVTWTGFDTGWGIARYELARSADGGVTWTVVSTSLKAPSATLTTPSSGTVMFRARAVDAAGNKGDWVAGPALSPGLVQDTSTSLIYGRTWTRASSSSFSGGSVRYAKVAGASASYRFTGRSVAFLTTRTPARGKVRIYLDGVFIKTVDTLASTTQYRYVAYSRTWTTAGTHTIRLVVAGTVGRPRVDLDAFAVLK